MTGDELASIAKHAPDQLDPDDVRACGRRLAMFEAASLESVTKGETEGGWYVTLHVDDLDLLEWVRT